MMREEKTIQGQRVVFRPLTWGAKQKALREATEWRRGSGGELEPDVDPWMLNDLMLLGSVEEWDIVDESGKPVPLTIEGLHGLEPRLAEALIAEMLELNGVTGAERKKS